MIRSLSAWVDKTEIILLRPRPSIGYFLVISLLCLCVGAIGFRITSDTNHDPGDADQSAYIHMVQKMQNSAYPWYSDGTRNPLFPWLAARFLDSSDPGFFESGKKLNVIFAAVGTALLGIFFGFRLGSLAAFNATALSTLVVLLPLATFFGAEVVFFVLFLFICAVAMRLLNTNPLWLYAVLGLLSGLAYLAKPSATPFLALFLGCSFLRLALNFLPPSRIPWWLSSPAWSPKRFFIGLALFGSLYFALITPRLIHAERTWGSAFYSLPGFWFWADDWETCQEKYTDCRAVTLAQMAPEDQPTLSGYFRRHNLTDALQRVSVGADVRLKQFFHPEGKWRFPYEKRGKLKRIVLPHRGLYILGLAALAVALGVMVQMRRSLPSLGPIGLPLLLALAMGVLYTLAMGWYLPTGPGHRFILTLYLPAVWLLVQGGEQFRQAANSRPANILFFIAHLFLSIFFLVRLGTLLIDGHFEKVIYAF